MLGERPSTSPSDCSSRCSPTASATSPLYLRLARQDEAPLVYAIMRAAFDEYAGKLPLESGALRETLADVQSAMASGGAVLAFLDTEAIGSARYTPEDDALYVGRVSVLPGYRRRGVASALMSFCEDLAQQLGEPAVRIGVRESLPGNIALYQKLGYRTVKIEPHGADRSWTMLKSLTLSDR